jgi:hypothetical protein
MAYQVFGQILFGILICGMLLVGPSVVVFYGWSEWRGELIKGKPPTWRRVLANVGILAVTTQTFLFVNLLIIIICSRVLIPYRFLLTNSVLAELVLLLLAAPCAFAWRGQAR